MHKQKLINALLYAVERDGHIGRTKLLKFIFFVDLIYYNLRETTLCGTTYIRMPKGPAEATAFQLTSESNAYFDVKAPTANAHTGRRRAGGFFEEIPTSRTNTDPGARQISRSLRPTSEFSSGRCSSG
jgi:hypothetical protein